MGTRGLIGTIADDALHGSYNQFDMYPTGVGIRLQNELRSFMAENEIAIDDLPGALLPMVRKMRYVNAQDNPTTEELMALSDTHDRGVSTGIDWYSALRECQGSLIRQLIVGIATDQPDFLQNSLFCEWSYIFDLDAKRVLILMGFNKDPDKQWERARVDVDKWKPGFEGDKLDYFGCTLAWEGSLPEFLALDMSQLEDDLAEEAA
jgi:hypothetical protein